jgi:hypothetical protein
VKRRLPLLALGSFVLGVALMIPFENVFTRIVGITALFVAIIAGVFAIATPEFLGADDEDDA